MTSPAKRGMARQAGNVVYQWRHALDMEGIWTELSPLDSW